LLKELQDTLYNTHEIRLQMAQLV